MKTLEGICKCHFFTISTHMPLHMPCTLTIHLSEGYAYNARHVLVQLQYMPLTEETNGFSLVITSIASLQCSSHPIDGKTPCWGHPIELLQRERERERERDRE